MRVRGAALTVAVVSASSAAWAAPCGTPELLFSTPPDDVEVPGNVMLEARYASTAEYLDEDILLTPSGEEERVMGGVFSENESTLTLPLRDPLEAGQDYELTWPGLRGVGSASKGRGLSVQFSVADTLDERAPVFSGLRDVTWDIEREHDSCTESVEERYLFDLHLPAVEDDFDEALLTLVVFQTAGPRTGDPEQIDTIPWTKAKQKARVSLAKKDSIGRACFAAVVRDSAGHVSLGGDVERCVHPGETPFFFGCSATAPRGPVRGGGLAVIAAAVGLMVARRRRV